MLVATGNDFVDNLRIDKIILESFQTQTFTKVYSETPYSKKMYHIETSQLICIANQLTFFFKTSVFTEEYFQSDLNLHQKQCIYLLTNEISEKEITF